MPRPNDMVRVDRLSDVLSERCMSQHDLSQRSGVGQSTISYAKRNGMTRQANAERMARALGVEPEALARPREEQPERLPERSALERIADALERIAAALEQAR